MDKNRTHDPSREGMTTYERHTVIIGYITLGIAIYAVIVFTFMNQAMQSIAG
jgi:hypothetical protein